MADSEGFYIYIARCRNQSLYTGITNDLKKRLKAHDGKICGGAKYTRSHPIVAIEAVWRTESRSAALRLEYAIKQLSRQQKLKLLTEPHLLCSRYIPSLAELPCTVCTDLSLT